MVILFLFVTPEQESSKIISCFCYSRNNFPNVIAWKKIQKWNSNEHISNDYIGNLIYARKQRNHVLLHNEWEVAFIRNQNNEV